MAEISDQELFEEVFGRAARIVVRRASCPYYSVFKHSERKLVDLEKLANWTDK